MAPTKKTSGPKVGASRNPALTKGVGTFSRSAMYHRSGKWAIKNKAITKKADATVAPKTKTIGGAKNGKTRTISAKAPRFYPAEDVPHKLASIKAKKTNAKLRSTITPGTVLILLAGRFRGKRVVFLKQLPSGLLLVSGPYKVNGVPVRRVNQAYVIATSTKLDISSITVDAKFDDAYFKKPTVQKKKKTEGEFFAEESAVTTLTPERKADQKLVDTPLLAIIKKTEMMKPYLNARFSLTNGQCPHEMVF